MAVDNVENPVYKERKEFVKLFSIFRKSNAADDYTPLTREQAIRYLTSFETDDCVVIPNGTYEKIVEFLASQLRPINDTKLLDVREKSTTNVLDMFIDGHPELKIRKINGDLLKVNLIIASLPDDIAQVSRKFVQRVVRLVDRENLVDRFIAFFDRKQE